MAMTRRTFVRLCGLAAASGGAGLHGERTIARMQAVTALASVDHLLLGTADLDHGMAWVEKLTGVRPAVGGSHPGMGTRNALLSLGGRQYLEVIAPDPAQTAYNFQIDVRGLAEPRLVTWAAASGDIDGLANRAKGAELQAFGPRNGSRVRPDGRTIEWRTLGVMSDLAANGVQPVPFFIQWSAASVHPSQDSPQGCRLTGFDIRHPQAGQVAALLRRLGIEADVRQSATGQLAATIDTPKGRVELT